ncbi:MAG: lipoyl synthase [Acidobacteria bacterium]|nr:lipoyl synthase [Spirochaetota bacterium]MBE3135327.1 lipoyl synthase [Acidobacteriota bacterium]
MSEVARRPDWLRKGKPIDPAVIASKARIAHLGLHTVCESARCPNLSECFQSGNATFLILGDACTRNCAFCAVGHGPASAPDPSEGKRIAEYMGRMEICYAVVTSVTRDDLPDGGAGHFGRVVADIRAALPTVGLELLVPDFQGSRDAVEGVAGLPIQVFGHNLETVESLYGRVRAGADYRRSLEVLRTAASARGEGVRIKTGIMVGLGETDRELERLFVDASGAGVQILTIGQYLRPSWANIPVARYLEPERFDGFAEMARARGIPVVQAGPYVRSSYLAESLFRGGNKNLTTACLGNIISDESYTD